MTVARDRLAQFMPPWIAVAIGLALLLALLFGLRMKLASDAEPVFKNIHALGEIPVQAIDRPVVQPKVIERPRLAGFWWKTSRRAAWPWKTRSTVPS